VTKKAKRAPGGGRKPSGPFKLNAAQLTVRMPDEMRDELEAAAHKRGWSLTQELLWRLRASLTREDHEQHQDRALRALCFLISEMARKKLCTGEPWYRDEHTERAGAPWHRDPFIFMAFRLAVAKLLEALQPPGELRRPRTKTKDYFYGTDTPESLADHAAKGILSDLYYGTPQDAEDLKAFVQAWKLPYMPQFGERMVEELERQGNTMTRARRDVGIDEPKEPKS